MADQILPEQPVPTPTAQVKKPFDAPARAEISSFFEPPPAFDFVLPGMPAGTVGAIISPGGAGKSMFALQVATTMAGAPDTLELGLKIGKVVYLPAEDPTLAIWHRIHAMSKSWDGDVKIEVSRNLHIHPLIGREPDLLSEEWFEWFEERTKGCRVLFLDTLRRFHLLDENSSGDMSKIIGRMEAISWKHGCCVIFLHHSSKSAAMGGHSDAQQASRGSSVLVDNIRWQAYMSGMSKEEAKLMKVDECERGFYVRFGISNGCCQGPWQCDRSAACLDRCAACARDSFNRGGRKPFDGRAIDEGRSLDFVPSNFA